MKEGTDLFLPFLIFKEEHNYFTGESGDGLQEFR